MNVLFVPALGLDPTLLERLAASVDFPVKHKVTLNNGPAGALDAFANAHRDWMVKESPVGNMGVASSWNWAANYFKDEAAWLMMNEDAWFLPGQLEAMCKCADSNPGAPIIHQNDTNSYYSFVWTAAGRNQFGQFDENFFPAYYEDCDMRVRHRLAGITSYPYALSGKDPVQHGKPITGGPNYGALINGAGLFLRSYWLKKWGALNFEKATYNNPYNDHRVNVSEWVYYPELRAKIQPLWDTFITMPNPAIYS